MIKAWVGENGKSHEKIYDVAFVDKSRLNAQGNKLAAVGNTVDIANASYDNSIGAGQLSVLWHDPEFNPDLEAFYYARVLEIPTPRFSTYDAKLLGVPAPEPATIQERAISSAIWYRVNTEP